MRKMRMLVATAVVAGSLATGALASGPVSAACTPTYTLSSGASPWSVATALKRATSSTKSIRAIVAELQTLNPRAASWGAGRRICVPAWARSAPTTSPEPVAPSSPVVRAYTTTESAAIIKSVFAAFAASASGVPETYSTLIQHVAVRIAWHESHLNNRNVNGSGCCVGLFQINYSAHRSWLASRLAVMSKEMIKDPTANSRAALILFKGRATATRPGSWCAWDTVVRERAWRDTVAAHLELAFDAVTGAIDPVKATRNKRLLGLAC